MNIATITRGIAVVPELARITAEFARWNLPLLIARVSDEPFDDDSEPDGHHEQFLPWQAGRLALEITTLVRSHRDLPQGHQKAMQRALEDLDSPQHTIDVVMALAGMLGHVMTEEDVEMFGKSLVEAEADS